MTMLDKAYSIYKKNLEESLKKWLQPTLAAATNPEEVGEFNFQNYHIVICGSFQQQIMLIKKQVWPRKKRNRNYP